MNFYKKIGVLAAIEPYMGRYYSAEYVRTKILKQTETEIEEIDAQIDKEIEEGILPDPAAMMDPETGMPLDPGMIGGASGSPMGIDGQSTEVKMPQRWGDINISSSYILLKWMN